MSLQLHWTVPSLKKHSTYLIPNPNVYWSRNFKEVGSFLSFVNLLTQYQVTAIHHAEKISVINDYQHFSNMLKFFLLHPGLDYEDRGISLD